MIGAAVRGAPRRPVPRSCPWALSAREEQRILDARARTNWGPMRLAALVDRHGGTVYRTRGLGNTVVIAIQDDHTRVVYAELHGAENAANVSLTLRRGAPWMREEGPGPVEAVLSNAKSYTGHQFAHTLDELGARHIRIPPYTPRWNGTLERFFGTLEDEWAHGRTWLNSATRDHALSSFIRYFNRWRPHSAAGGRPPITRVQKDRKQDS